MNKVVRYHFKLQLAGATLWKSLNSIFFQSSSIKLIFVRVTCDFRWFKCSVFLQTWLRKENSNTKKSELRHLNYWTGIHDPGLTREYHCSEKWTADFYTLFVLCEGNDLQAAVEMSIWCCCWNEKCHDQITETPAKTKTPAATPSWN